MKHLIFSLMALLAFSAAPAAARQETSAAQTAASTIPASPAAWSKPQREMMIPVEGGRVWVRIDGDLASGAVPAIMIHGGPGGTHMTFGKLFGLADERPVIAYDQLGSGLSDRPDDPADFTNGGGVDRFVRTLETIRDTLGIERWHVIGYSWGSAIALRYAAEYPQYTASAVLMGTFISTPHWIMGTNLLIRDLPDAVQANLIACESDTPPDAATCAAANRAFYAAYNGRPDRPAPTPAEDAYRAAYGGQGFNADLYNYMWGPSEFSATGTLLTYNDVPLLSKGEGKRILFLIGQYDEARLDTVQDFVKLTPGAEFGVVPGGSHAFPSERPIETEAMLRAWMERLDRAEGPAS